MSDLEEILDRSFCVIDMSVFSRVIFDGNFIIFELELCVRNRNESQEVNLPAGRQVK